jgi:hypothetical protein
MKFNGVDGGVEITALTLDMSEAGAATFNSTVTVSTVAYVGTSIVHDGDTDTSIDFDTNVNRCLCRWCTWSKSSTYCCNNQ